MSFVLLSLIFNSIFLDIFSAPRAFEFVVGSEASNTMGEIYAAIEAFRSESQRMNEDLITQLMTKCRALHENDIKDRDAKLQALQDRLKDAENKAKEQSLLIKGHEDTIALMQTRLNDLGRMRAQIEDTVKAQLFQQMQSIFRPGVAPMFMLPPQAQQVVHAHQPQPQPQPSVQQLPLAPAPSGGKPWPMPPMASASKFAVLATACALFSLRSLGDFDKSRINTESAADKAVREERTKLLSLAENGEVEGASVKRRREVRPAVLSVEMSDSETDTDKEDNDEEWSEKSERSKKKKKPGRPRKKAKESGDN